MPRQPDKGASRDDRPWSVSTLALRIGESLRSLPTSIRLIGEVSQVSDRTHIYFDLKDDGAVINCVMFASAARRTRIRPVQGEQVVVGGRVEFYAKGGRTTFIVERIERVGEGAHDRAFRELFEELKSRGWFDPSVKRPLPTFPRRVAVLTSSGSAALQDVLDTLRRRSPWIEVLVVDVFVQGDRAALDLSRAIRWLDAHRERRGIDGAILTRGGGSAEDLGAFNDLRVATAIHESACPIVAAIGHETDTTIAELVADERAATPTQAAMRMSPDRAALDDQLASVISALQGGVVRRIAQGARDADWHARHALSAVRSATGVRAARLERVSGGLARVHPAAGLARRRAVMERREDALHRSVMGTLADAEAGVDPRRLVRALAVSTERARSRIDAAAGALTGLNPMRILHRGFSLTYLPGGQVIRSKDQVRPGTTMITRVADGAFESVASGRPAKGGSSARKRPTRADDAQMDLFASPD